MAEAGAYVAALQDWLACACAGAGERAARAVRASGEDLLTEVAFAGTAGHVLDFDDTFPEGVAHVSAACAPAALVLAAHLELPLRSALQAYAEGFEAMAAVAQASHPVLYDRGWHPTAVCGPIGAATAAAGLLELDGARRDQALRVALLRAGGARGAFGSDGKAIQVGMAAASGVQGALVARGGARVSDRAVGGPVGLEAVLGARLAAPAAGEQRAIERNWIKLYPSCLGTHAAIEAAAVLREGDGRGSEDDEPQVRVHPVSRQAAHLDDVEDGLSAKFSIPYCVAFTLAHGPPGVRDFETLDPQVRRAAGRIRVAVDRSLPEFGAALCAAGGAPVVIPCPLGSPERPASVEALAAKLAELTCGRLDGVLEDPDAPAARALEAAGLAPSAARAGG